ncbi:ribose 5-phosphate isomerase B [Candidatus Woesearchaeota archaeon]|nr:MAG: ribose 5-phosphate isomerase B [Candidatus Woesearchaeota archaeon]
MVVIGADHGGFSHKEAVVKHLRSLGYEVVDVGTKSADSVDYPDFAKLVCEKVQADPDNSVGILICGTGIGMSMAANKFKGIRAALCHDEYTTRMAREHNNANVLCMGGRVLSEETAVKLAELFLKTPFSGEERHNRRIGKVDSFLQC